MEALIILVVAAGLLWLVFSGSYKTKLQDPETLRPSEIENSIVELKEKILVTSMFAAEAQYRRLSRRLTSLMQEVLEQHQRFVLDVETGDIRRLALFRSYQHHDSNGMLTTSYAVPWDLNLPSFDSSHLLYASFLLWHGGRAQGVGPIDSNPKLMLKILDYLVSERSYAPAMFLKGLVRKYGLHVHSECFPAEAKELLERAQREGVGSATIELKNIDRYFKLAGIKSIHLGE